LRSRLDLCGWCCERAGTHSSVVKETISAAEARRIAIAAQGLAGPRPPCPIGPRHIRRVIDQIGLLQIDSVNIVVRAHYMPLFSRLGPYDQSLLDDLAYREKRLFEGWGHVASLMPVEHYPMLRPRMASGHPGTHLRRLITEGYVDAVLDEIRRRGPLAASGLADPGDRSGPWWGYGKGKATLEWLLSSGRLSASRTSNFERVYDLVERSIPARILNAPPLTGEQAHRQMLRLALRALGVATAADLADYYRLKTTEASRLLQRMVADGEASNVRVTGWKAPAFLQPGARIPRSVEARALLSPFDSLIFNRRRVERLFGFRYRIEIYVPEPQRVFGYYVYPFLLGDRLVARVDLKADRKSRTLLVRGAFVEPGNDPGEVAGELATELGEVAKWLGLARISAARRGNLGSCLSAALKHPI